MSHISAPDFAPYEGCDGEWVEARNFRNSSKSFGYFACMPCGATWMSAHAKKGFKQGCKNCDRYFYPLYMWENTVKLFGKKEKSLEDNEKPHMSWLC